MALDAHPAHHIRHRLWAELLHQVGRDVVRAVRETPFQCDGLTDPLLLVGASRGPGVAVRKDERLRKVHDLVARSHTLLHRQRVEERFDRRTDLTLALTDIVVLEIAVVRTSDVGLHVSRARLHRHEGRTENRLVVTDRIVRRHRSVGVTFLIIGEHTHLHRSGERLEDLSLGQSLFLEGAVTVAPTSGLTHDPVPCLLVYVIGERLVGLAPQIPAEVSLKVADPLGDSLLGIFLHLVVDGRVDPQTVPVKVILASVSLLVLLKPAIQVVRGPGKRVGGIVLDHRIVGLARLSGVHHAANHIPEIRGQTGVVVLHLIVELYRDQTDGIPLGLVQIAGLLHLADHKVPSGQSLVRIDGRIVPRRLVDHSHKHSALLDRKLGRELPEECLRSRTHTVRTAAEEYGVEVHRHNLVLGVVPFELHGGDPFLQLDPHHFGMIYSRNPTPHLGPRIKGLRQLLGDRAAAALA